MEGWDGIEDLKAQYCSLVSNEKSCSVFGLLQPGSWVPLSLIGADVGVAVFCGLITLPTDHHTSTSTPSDCTFFTIDPF